MFETENHLPELSELIKAKADGHSSHGRSSQEHTASSTPTTTPSTYPTTAPHSHGHLPASF